MENIDFKKIDDNVWQIVFSYPGILTTEQLSNVNVDIFDDKGNEYKRLRNGYATNINYSSPSRISIVKMQALE
jgi:hypothetical protein